MSERLTDVRDKILDIFNPDTQADESIANPACAAFLGRYARVGHGRGMRTERFRAAQTFREGKDPRMQALYLALMATFMGLAIWGLGTMGMPFRANTIACLALGMALRCRELLRLHAAVQHPVLQGKGTSPAPRAPWKGAWT